METTEAPPTILNNLATVLDYTEKAPAGNGWLRNGVVIAHRNDSRDPFVVWDVAQQTDGTWEAFTGHYCTNVMDAVDRYRERTS